MKRSRRVIKAGGEEVVESFSFRLRGSVGVFLVRSIEILDDFFPILYNFPGRCGV